MNFMSLSSLIHDRHARKELYKKFTKPIVKGRPEAKLKALTRNYSAVGIAFDYLARLYLLRLYPNAKRQKTVAEITDAQFNKPGAWHYLTAWTDPVYDMAEEMAWDLLISASMTDGAESLEEEPCPYPFLRGKEHYLTSAIAQAYRDKVHEIVKEAKETRKQYISGARVPIKKLAEQCLQLARIDPLYRSGRPEPTLGDTDPKDIEDLVALFRLFEKQTWLRGKKHVFLNPTFGRASALVGHADCDLILDDVLIEIKCIKNRDFFGPVFHQLLGYYILSTIGGVGEPPRFHEINHLGIYYARHGELLVFPVQDFIPKSDLADIQKWFKKLARQHLSTRPTAPVF